MVKIRFGNGNKIDTSSFVQKPELRTNYTEVKTEEDIAMKSQFRIKNLPCLIENTDAVCKFYVDSALNDPSIIRNNIHVDFKNKNLDDVRFVKINSLPAVRQHLTPKFNVDETFSQSVNESSLLRLDPHKKLKLDVQDSIIPNSTLTPPKTIEEMTTKSFVDSLHENSRSRRDLSTVFSDQDYAFDNIRLTNLDSTTINKDRSSNNEISNRNYLADSIKKIRIVRFNQTLENYLKITVGNGTYNETKINKIQITDATKIEVPDSGGYLIQQ